MFKDYFTQIIEKRITSFINSDDESFYYDKDSNKNLEIEYGITKEELYDFVRAWSFKDRPKPYFKINGKKIFLLMET